MIQNVLLFQLFVWSLNQAFDYIHLNTSSTISLALSIFSIYILWIFFTPSVSFSIYYGLPNVKATPLSLCLPVLPTLCKYMSTSMISSLSDFFGAPTFITNTAFLISIPLAMMFVHINTLVSEFLNFLIMDSFSVCYISTFLPSL